MFIPSSFWTTCTRLDNFCLRCVSSCGKILYRCTSTFSVLNYCSGIFFKSLSYLYEVVRTTFQPIVGLFETFDRNFTNLVASPSDKNKNYVVQLKEKSFLKKKLQTSSKSAYKRQRNACSNYAPLERTSRRPLSVTYKKHSDKYHVFAPTAGARYTIFPKLCIVIELVETIKKVPIIF